MFVPQLKISEELWTALIKHLRIQGGGVRESGAFLLGHKTNTGKVIIDFLPYDQLQEDALNDDYVSLSAGSFSKLWKLCHSKHLSVVADIHTHRFGPGQSLSDRNNPMIALSGHIAFIVPHFAQGRVLLRDLGMYIYEGNHQWRAYSGEDIDKLVQLTIDGGVNVYV